MGEAHVITQVGARAGCPFWRSEMGGEKTKKNFFDRTGSNIL